MRTLSNVRHAGRIFNSNKEFIQTYCFWKNVATVFLSKYSAVTAPLPHYFTIRHVILPLLSTSQVLYNSLSLTSLIHSTFCPYNQFNWPSSRKAAGVGTVTYKNVNLSLLKLMIIEACSFLTWIKIGRGGWGWWRRLPRRGQIRCLALIYLYRE